MNDFLNKRNPNASFVVKNISTKSVKIFNNKIGPGNTLNLMSIPNIAETDIQDSLSKGTLYSKISGGELQIITSTIDIIGAEPNQKLFLTNNSIPTLSAISTSYSSQTTWYIDPTSGIDTNTGLTSGTAIKTWAEFIKRVGVSPTINITINVYLLGDIPATDPVVFSPIMSPTGKFYIHGTLTAVSAGTGSYTSVLTRSTTINRPVSVTDTARASWTANVGNMIKNTGGTAGSIGAYAWIVKDTGSNTARLTTLLAVDSSKLYESVTNKNPVVSDTYSIYTLSKIEYMDIKVSSTFGFNYNSSIRGLFSVENVDIGKDLYQSEIHSQTTGVIFAGCKFSGGASFSGIIFSNCLSNSYDFSSAPGAHSFFYGGGSLAHFYVQWFSKVSLANGWLLQAPSGGGAAIVNRGYLIIEDAAVFDWINSFSGYSGVHVSPNALLDINGVLWGTSSTTNTIALTISGKAIINDYSELRMVGQSAVNFRVDGLTTLPPFNSAASPPVYKTLISNTWVNLLLAVASNGFGSCAINPKSGNGITYQYLD